MSFLEALDIVNHDLLVAGKEPVAFEHDCREGICGSCGAMVNGRAHGPGDKSTLCQLHMRSFKDGETIVVEPWRSERFPVLRDLVVDRSSFDQASSRLAVTSRVRTGSAPDANAIPVPKTPLAEEAMSAAECIGCGACVAACPNGSAMPVHVGAKLAHLSLAATGAGRALSAVTPAMVGAMDAAGFGHCTNHGECEAVCPEGDLGQVDPAPEPRIPAGGLHVRRSGQGFRRRGLKSLLSPRSRR
jgi:succinate dehydrogenase / fumarate reductase iron-sulfur subunit